MTPPTKPLDPGVTQTPKPKCVTREKTLCNVKCPDGYPYTVKLISRAAPGPSWLVSYNVYVSVSHLYYFGPSFITIHALLVRLCELVKQAS